MLDWANKLAAPMPGAVPLPSALCGATVPAAWRSRVLIGLQAAPCQPMAHRQAFVRRRGGEGGEGGEQRRGAGLRIAPRELTGVRTTMEQNPTITRTKE
jgi:hypothetical protein